MATGRYYDGAEHAYTNLDSESNQDADSPLPFGFFEFIYFVVMEAFGYHDGVDFAYANPGPENDEGTHTYNGPIPVDSAFLRLETDTAGDDEGVDHAHTDSHPGNNEDSEKHEDAEMDEGSEDSENSDDEDDDDDDEDDEDPWRLLPFDAEFLQTWATVVRNELMNSGNDTAPVECTSVLDPMSGSYNTVFPLVFSDGIRWALKVPQTIPSGGFDASAAHTLTTEALAIRFIKQETTIPVPEVHRFHAGMDNSLQYPYILTDFIDGVPLYEVWFDHSEPELLESRRMNALQDIASAMVQLGKFTFSRGGSPVFDSNGRISDVGSERKADVAASLAAKDEDSEVWCDLGPFTNAKSYLLAMLDRRDPPPDEYSRGIYKLLRLFIDWLSELENLEDDGDFVLAHPDLDIQNIMVTKEGRVCGLIDWEGVAVVPACTGNLCYPSFLTRDWDSMAYSYDENGTAEENEKENSPEELQHFRAAYSNMIEKLYGSMGTKCPSWTRKSLLIENLKIAADNLVTTHGIVDKVFEEMGKDEEKPLEFDDEELDVYEVACELAEACLDEGKLELLKDRFLHLCNSL
ncbi:kinase-like domain-containing protein [Nemania serpens]|nr:kinase-like domain-containing protein [Nemania serpens]